MKRRDPDAAGQDLAGLVPLLNPLQKARGLVLAVSGGPDSTALMHLAADWRSRVCHLPVAVACVDHGLRPESRAEAEQVVAAARRLGLPAAVLTWTGEKPSRGLPARARAARYELLAAHARVVSASHLVTAHTRDDQAETVLMRLARGSGISGLAGMRNAVDLDGLTLSRPLLGVGKQELVAICRARNWAFVDDPTNRDRAYARARWRSLGPALAREGLTAEGLSRLAWRMARADQALESFAADAAARAQLDGMLPGSRIDFRRLSTLPDEILIRVLAKAVVDVSGRAQPRLARLEDLTGELTQALNDGRSLRRTFHNCVFSVDRTGILSIVREGERRRGRKAALQHNAAYPAASDPLPAASLGNATPASYIANVAAPARLTDVVETHSASVAPARGPMLSTGPQ